MKKVIISLSLCLFCMVGNAQMARWIMQPVYDKIYMAKDAARFICDSLGTSSIWSIDGKKLASTDDVINLSNNGFAVTTEKGSENITGFFNTKGEFTSLNNYTVTYNEPFFKDGYLLVNSVKGYHFINEAGEEVKFGDYIKMYPFNNGFAVGYTYEQPDKRKGRYYEYIADDNSKIPLSYGGKTFDKEDVEFLSSVNDDGVGIAVIKKKVYFFDGASRELQPVFANKSETNVKRQVVLVGQINEYINRGDSILGKGAKKKYVRFKFDKQLRLTEINFADRTEYFQQKEAKGGEITSPFTTIKSNDNKFGLKYDGQTALPEQFDEVGVIYNDFAVVRIGNKWGMLTYDKSLKYEFELNDKNKIAFRHKIFKTKIRLKLPEIISSTKCDFYVEKEYGCEIDKISVENRETKHGNTLQYDCELNIPDTLTAKETSIEYPVQIVYDGLKHPLSFIKTTAWHYKYITPVWDKDETEKDIEAGTISFTFDLDINRKDGDDDYPFEVKLYKDSLESPIPLNKLSETRYKCDLLELTEGGNMIYITINEEGCPPLSFPKKITYTKPVKKSRKNPEVKGSIEVQDVQDKDMSI